MNLTKILTVVLFLAALAVGYMLYDGINATIEEAKKTERIENTVKTKLELIRSVQEAYQSTFGNYAETWEKLIAYADTGNIYIIQRTEKITMLDYGAEKSEFFYDTIGVVAVRDSLIKGNMDVTKLPELPHAPGKYFSLYTKDSVRNGVNVDYIEVVDVDLLELRCARTENQGLEVKAVVVLVEEAF